MIRFGLIGGGSWATAIAKMLTDNKLPLQWWIRSEAVIKNIQNRHHNPNYLSTVYFDTALLKVSDNLEAVITNCDCIIIAIPSAYVAATFKPLPANIFKGKQVVSAVKGILPEENLLLNDYLNKYFQLSISDYYTIMGPCHAEEIAAEKLSYLTFSGEQEVKVQQLADHFKSYYLNPVINNDIYGVQFAAILKNIYALGAGIAHGLEYGDNFLSVLIANCADEMAGFLRKAGIRNIEVGIHGETNPVSHKKTANYAASVYLGDLLVTCYSPFSRNRSFGNMIGKGYSVKATQLEMNMVAEGYNASKCIHFINQDILAEIPIADTIYQILWGGLSPKKGFNSIEGFLV